MNKFLSEGLSLINSFLAILITLFGGVFGYNIFGYSFGGAIGVLAGLVGGFMVATLVCGILAVFLDIRDELVLANNLSLELLNELKKEQK